MSECKHEWFEGRCVHCTATPDQQAEIERLRRELAEARSRRTCGGDQPYICHDLATARSRLTEIIGYCAQEGHDGEPWDTIHSLASGELQLRVAHCDHEWHALGIRRGRVVRMECHKCGATRPTTPDQPSDAMETPWQDIVRHATRYLWLRSRINWRDTEDRGINTVICYRSWEHRDYRDNPPVSEHIDEYIDAAIAADKSNPLDMEPGPDGSRVLVVKEK